MKLQVDVPVSAIEEKAGKEIATLRKERDSLARKLATAIAERDRLKFQADKMADAKTKARDLIDALEDAELGYRNDF